jgi:hypothetical protein
MALGVLIFSSLTLTASAGTITTTTTTVTTVKKVKCGTTHKKYHHRKYRCSYYNDCPSYTYYYDDSSNTCPGGAYDCYFDTHGNYFKQSYLPVTYDHNVKYNCLASDDPGSCS